MPVRYIVSSLFIAVLVAVAGCGGGDETTTVTVTGPEAAASSNQDAAALRTEVASLRDEVKGAKAAQPDQGAPQGFRASGCGAGVYVKASTTSCAFALNVAADYFSAPGYTFYSYSPVTGKTYLVRCTHGYPALCKAGSARIVIT
jgi:hypothetical protein